MNAMVEPLPLVPATWITGGSRRCGSLSAARMRHIRSSDRSMRLGCSCVSRATMESIAVMFSTLHARLEHFHLRWMHNHAAHCAPLPLGALLWGRVGDNKR